MRSREGISKASLRFVWVVGARRRNHPLLFRRSPFVVVVKVVRLVLRTGSLIVILFDRFAFVMVVLNALHVIEEDGNLGFTADRNEISERETYLRGEQGRTLSGNAVPERRSPVSATLRGSEPGRTRPADWPSRRGRCPASAMSGS